MNKINMRLKHFIIFIWIFPGCHTFTVNADEQPSGREIVQNCAYKNPGQDQRSTFTVLLKDNLGEEKKSIYLRLWKDFKGADDIADKMLLFTEFPPDAKGAAFLRANYVRSKHKNADQWIYLPTLGKTRRVTIRDPGDSFLNSELAYADVENRVLDEDQHTFIGFKDEGGVQYYVVESVPVKDKDLYSKRIQWFTKTEGWDSCLTSRIYYYDSRGDLLKEQFLAWQNIGDAWVWDKVQVNNLQTNRSSVFVISAVRINTGLKDDIFSSRTLRLGSSVVETAH